ncbi:hypothetical protein CcCBS67573_g08848 [Chytriomyces confervae]|uniref:Mitochondrial carrier protein n=1 Tax=Chytriomyces confervae TaxID=246404 RepID=A0A507EDG1_9FUNG|nr:hypothetical protein CcCBS67573_g08848 [Chytriomyces confervae]
MGGHGSNKNGNESLTSRLLGSGLSGILELVCFHPVDTIAKRLMTSTKKPFSSGQSSAEGFKMLNQVIFKDAANQSTFVKYKSLFPGVGFAAGYKVMQRMYKFSGQRYVRDYLQNNHQSSFKSMFGDNWKTMMHATAGRGATWTAARNAPGSFALFGGSAFVKEHMFNLSDYNQATFFQNFCASIGGAFASLAVSSPLDVIKTRIQARSAESAESGWVILSQMVKNEGFGSFFKGLVPKMLVVGPKLVFSFTIADASIPIISSFIDGKK